MAGLRDVLYLGQPEDIHSSAEWNEVKDIELLDSRFTSELPLSSMMYPVPESAEPLSGLGET